MKHIYNLLLCALHHACEPIKITTSSTVPTSGIKPNCIKSAVIISQNYPFQYHFHHLHTVLEKLHYHGSTPPFPLLIATYAVLHTLNSAMSSCHEKGSTAWIPDLEPLYTISKQRWNKKSHVWHQMYSTCIQTKTASNLSPGE